MKTRAAIAYLIKKGKIVLSLVLLLATAASAQKEFDGLRGTHNWIGFSDAPNALYHHIADEAYTYLGQRAAKIAAINTLAGWQQRQRWIKTTLREVIGPLPEKTPLNATITSKFNKEGFRLENIIYESQPGYFVTSALYIPENALKAPAIIYCSGHSENGYRSNGYQNEILNFVKKGFVVFAFDPMGQGERLQYYDSAKGKSSFRWPSFEHSYAGAQLFITGNTLARDFIWDGIRAVDYLITRKEVDAARIGITGRSGGGTQSAYIAALDDRIAASAPENYITSMKRLFQSMGPQDAEQNFFYGIQKGLDMADLLAVRAPKPTMVVTTSQDMFPIQGAIETVNEVARIYKAYGKPGNFSMVTDDAPHASTKKNREAVYAFFQKTLDNPGNPQEEEVKFLSAQELTVTKTGQVSTSLEGETASSINSKDVEKRTQVLEAKRKQNANNYAEQVKSARQLSGFKDPRPPGEPVFAGQIQRDGYVIQKYLLKGEGAYNIPYILFKPQKPSHKAMLYLDPNGKAKDAAPGKEIEWFVKNGITVLAPDLIGIGEMGPGEFKGDSYIDSVSYNVWFGAMLNGRSIVGIRAGDVVRLVNQLKKDAALKEIYGLAKKQMSPVLLHAAAFCKDISKVALIEPYVSYRSIVASPKYNPHFLHSTVAGAIGVYDLPDLAASLAPKSLLIVGVTDGNGSPINSKEIDRDMSVIKEAYERNTPARLRIVEGGTNAQLTDQLKQWINDGSK